MPNPLQIRSHSRLLRRKAQLLFEDIQKDYDQGLIKTQTEYYHRIYTGLDELYSQLGAPSLKVRSVYGPPSSEDYNDTIREIKIDFSTVFSEIEAVKEGLQNSFEQTELDRQALHNRVSQIGDRLKGLPSIINHKTNQIFFRDSFIHQKYYDKEMVEGTPAEVNIRETVLTLAKLEGEEYQDNLTISITKDSNGFPGDTHQVKVTGGLLGFSGEDDPHLDLKTAIDGNKDTWFEYELWDISEQVRQETKGFGFDYREGMSWIKADKDPLRLGLLIELPSAKTLNWISLSSFIPPHKGATPALLEFVIIDDGKGTKQQVNLEPEILNEDKIYLFSRQKCKYIHLLFKQDSSYESWAGHIHYKEAQNASSNFFEDVLQQGRRVPGTKPSIETLGLRFDPTTQTITYPKHSANQVLLDKATLIHELFSIPSAINKQGEIETINASRYHIGIRDITAANYRFDVSSNYVSTLFKTLKPISEISLTAKDQILAEFPAGDWIKYFISIDDGKTWLPISPYHTLPGNTKTKYVINSGVSSEMRHPSTGYLETLQPVYGVRTKIELRRPVDIPDADYYSPIVYEYTVAVTEAKE